MIQTLLTRTPAKRRIAGAERFFQWSLYLLVVTGFIALMGTNKLDLPALVLVLPALLYRGYLLLMHREFTLPERWTTWLTLVYFVFYAADFFYISQSFIGATVHMVLFSLVVKVFSVRRDRDLIYLAVLSFLMLLAAAVLTVDTLFLLTFALYIMVAIATFVSMEMRRSQREALASEIPERQETNFQRSLAGIATILAAFTMAGSALLFFVIPRISTAGYLRNFGVQGAMTTGFSQDVRLGGIGQIQQSSAVVMHVQVLDGKLPPDPKWRGVSLENFDGQRWWNNPEPIRFHGLSNAPLDVSRVYSAGSGFPGERLMPMLTYRVVMEPVALDVFFLAPVPVTISGNYPIIAISPDGSVFNRKPGSGGDVSADFGSAIGTYTATADTRSMEPLVRNSVSTNYPPRISFLYLQLPHLDPRISELAHKVTAGAASNYQKARAIDEYLKTHFSYTLQLPGSRNRDQVSYFLFERKKGHCEYFASSMAVMLRTLGIPARVVNGFRGGEYNDLTGSYIIRESDAHSWVEAYFPEAGWVTFDPTPGGNLQDGGKGWSRVALYLDAASELWREWVVNYDFSHQMKLSAEISTSTGHAQSSLRQWFTRKYRGLVNAMGSLQERLGKLKPSQMAIACVILGLLLALPFSPKAWRSFQRIRALRNPERAPRSAASFWYLRLLKKLNRKGYRKQPAQTPAEFAESIDDASTRADVVTFTAHYERARFDGSAEDAQKLPELFEEITAKK